LESDALAIPLITDRTPRLRALRMRSPTFRRSSNYFARHRISRQISRDKSLLGFARIVFSTMLMVDGIECVSRGDNTASRQVVCDATSRRDATRRDATRRGAVRSGGWNFPRPPPRSALRASSRFDPRPLPYHSSLTPSNLPRPPPRALSSRCIVSIYRRTRTRITPRNRVDRCFARPIRRSAESDTSGEYRVSASAKDHRCACDFRTRVRHRCSIAQYRCRIDENDDKQS